MTCSAAQVSMHASGRGKAVAAVWRALVLLLLLLTACSCRHRTAVRRLYENPYGIPRSFAVTVFRNLSGSESLDMVAVTDEFCSELADIEGLQVVPVNQVLAAMMDLNLNRVTEDVDIAALADRLGVDAVIVGAVTQYDPYFPPMLGMTLRLYTATVHQRDGEFINPRQLAQTPRDFGMGSTRSYVPCAVVSRLFDAGTDPVVDRIEAYAESRQENLGPYGWKKMTTQRHYVRFVAHEMIGELMAAESDRVNATGPVGGQ